MAAVRQAQTRIVTGWPGQRSAALKAALTAALSAASGAAPGHARPGEKIVLILEGAPADGTQEIAVSPDISLHILAPGCMCCSGNLALRVTLARVLRLERPGQLILALADARHLERLQQMLSAPPYDVWIKMDKTP